LTGDSIVRNVAAIVVDARGHLVVTPVPGGPAPLPLTPGESVAVRTRFDGTWADGFRVRWEHEGSYVVERCSDGFVLPADFSAADVRPTETPTT
jgi:hypothetical protein